MASVLFLTSSKFKAKTPVQENVDDGIIRNYIDRAQETHIHQALGTDLYNAIKTKVENSTLTGVYKTLMDDYIQPALIECAFYEILPFVSLKLTNKSIGRGNADYLAEADLDDLKYLRNAVRDMMRFRLERLIDYLKQYSSSYPEYNTNSGLDKIQPQYSQNFFGGIYTGKRGNDCDFGTGENWTDLF